MRKGKTLPLFFLRSLPQGRLSLQPYMLRILCGKRKGKIRFVAIFRALQHKVLPLLVKDILFLDNTILSILVLINANTFMR